MNKPDNSILKVFGQRLKDRRIEQRLSRVELMSMVRGYQVDADSANKVLRSWENGDHAISINTLLLICDALNCDVDYLLGRIDTPTHTAKSLSKDTGLSVDFIQKLISYRHKYKGYIEDFSGTNDESLFPFDLYSREYPPDPRIQILEYLYDERGLLKAIDAYIKLDSIDSVSIDETSYETFNNTTIKINNFEIDYELLKESYISIIRDKLNILSRKLKEQNK